MTTFSAYLASLCPRFRRPLRWAPGLGCMVGFIGMSSSVQALTFVWDGSSQNSRWGTAANWDKNSSTPGAGDTAVFNAIGAARLSVDIDSTSASPNIRFVGGILFEGTATYSLSNSTGDGKLSIGAGGITNNSSVVQNFLNLQGGLIVGVSQTWAANTGNLSITGPVANTNVLTLTAGSTQAGTISGAVTGTGGSVVKSGSGSWVLSGANNYTGGTIVSGGTLRFSGANTSVGNVSVASGATLEIGATNTLPGSTGLTLGGGTLTLTGNFNQSFTTGLNLSVGTTSTIDFGTEGSANTISFGSSSGNWTTGTSLTITNYTFGSDQLRFGADATGLSTLQLAGINFSGFAPGAEIDSSGFVTPVPEPSTFAALAGVTALALAAYRRRNARARLTPNSPA